jgi:hypothetical protein
MTGSGRLRVLAVSGIVVGLVLLTGARAWATVRRAEAGCGRVAAMAAGHSAGAGTAVAGAARRAGAPQRPAAGGRTGVDRPASLSPPAGSDQSGAPDRPSAGSAGARQHAGDRASWRSRMLRAAGCQAWREIHNRRYHAHHTRSRLH